MPPVQSPVTMVSTVPPASVRRYAPPRPLRVPPKTIERPKAAIKDRVVSVTTLSDPSQEMDKVQELYQNLVEARREAGQDGLPFPKFAELIKKQVGTLRLQGSSEVAFRVALKDGKVAFTARAMKDGSSED